jgi:glycosyltransferase involved in cell wall biosynthesis
MKQIVIALLGRKDEPTDAVEEYCRYLSDALEAHDMQLQIRRVPWNTRGWSEAFRGLRLQAERWRDAWVLVQYTALAWSKRGFPQKFLKALKILKAAGAQVTIIFHDVEPYPGARLVDAFRRTVQVRTMRRALELADLAVFTVPPEKVTWGPKRDAHVAFIPVGPNLPIPSELAASASRSAVLTVGVFGITGGETGARETKWIIEAVRRTAQQVGKLRLSVFGRHAELRDQDLTTGLRGLPVELSVEGVLDPAQVVRRLIACDVLLFVRGGISSRRGSAIAGIACGLPVIAFSGSETAAPITDAGVILVCPDAPDRLNAALASVLADPALRAELAARSRAVYAEHLAWPAIAWQFAARLRRRS